MADEDKVEGKEPEKPVVDAKPTLDVDAIAQKAAQAATAGMVTWLREQQTQVPPPAREEDALEQVMGPYIDKRVGGRVAQASLAAEAAADKADFYTVNDQEELADRSESKVEVERRFNALLAAGRPTPRGDIWNHLKGEQEKERSEKRRKKSEAREAARLEAGDEGALGAPRVRGDVPKGVPGSSDAAYSLLESKGSEGLDKALEGTAF